MGEHNETVVEIHPFSGAASASLMRGDIAVAGCHEFGNAFSPSSL